MRIFNFSFGLFAFSFSTGSFAVNWGMAGRVCAAGYICKGAIMAFLNERWNSENRKFIKYLKSQPLIDKIDLFQDWTFMKRDVMNVTANIIGAENADKFEFINLKQFKETLIEMSDWLIEQGINDEGSAVILDCNGKSSGWVLANLMKYTIVKPKKFVDFFSQEKVKKLFLVDDASFSGRQLKYQLDNMFPTSYAEKVYIGVPFITAEAKKRLEQFQYGYAGNQLTIYDKAHRINQIILNVKDGPIGLMAFEHKVPDHLSVPSDLSYQLETLFWHHVPLGKHYPPYKAPLDITRS